MGFVRTIRERVSATRPARLIALGSTGFPARRTMTPHEIALGYRMLLGRDPTPEERAAARDPDGGRTDAGRLLLLLSRSDEFRDRFGLERDLPPPPLTYDALFGTDAFLGAEPTPLPLRSALCRQAHFALDQYRFWIRACKEQPRLHRKQWEYFFVAQALWERGLLDIGRRGIGFGVGREPLPALFASFGAAVLATDQSLEDAIRGGWAATDQHSVDLSALNDRGICSEPMFREKVGFAAADMNAIGAEHDDRFDFCWSTCALEHLGSLRHGMDFVRNSLRVLRPGGVAVHTTEFNLSSNDGTVEERDLSLFRRRDIDALIGELERDGHRVEPIDWTPGVGLAETVADLPPYADGLPHIRLRTFQYDCTSIGLIVTRNG